MVFRLSYHCRCMDCCTWVNVHITYKNRGTHSVIAIIGCLSKTNNQNTTYLYIYKPFIHESHVIEPLIETKDFFHKAPCFIKSIRAMLAYHFFLPEDNSFMEQYTSQLHKR